MSKGILYEDIMAVLRKHAELPYEYWNPAFLSEVNALLECYGDIDDKVVNNWVSNMWSC
jgi:hypothetical protein